MKNRSKKYYTIPKLETVMIDSVVSLNPPSLPFGGGNAAPVGRDRPSSGSSSASPSSLNNPFGTSRPDYGDM